MDRSCQDWENEMGLATTAKWRTLANPSTRSRGRRTRPRTEAAGTCGPYAATPLRGKPATPCPARRRAFTVFRADRAFRSRAWWNFAKLFDSLRFLQPSGWGRKGVTHGGKTSWLGRQWFVGAGCAPIRGSVSAIRTLGCRPLILLRPPEAGYGGRVVNPDRFPSPARDRRRTCRSRTRPRWGRSGRCGGCSRSPAWPSGV